MTPTPRQLQRARVRLQALVDAYPELRDPDAQARLGAWLEKEQRTMTEQKGQPKGDTTAYVRMKRMRERRLQEGWQTYQVWLRGEDAALLLELKQPGENLSETFARGLHALKAQATQGATPMAGGTLHPAQYREAMAARILAMHEQPMSQRKIASQLNAEGVPTLTGYGKWRHEIVGELLAEAKAK
jgi:hypothetical protein